MSTDAAAEKSALRARIRAARAQRSAAERARVGEAISDVVLALPEIVAATVVSAYLDKTGEPPTVPLLNALARQSKHVLLPVQKDDGELDWARYDGKAILGPHGIHEPTAERLGAEAIAQVEVIVVPALAVDRHGNRLGQGGGGYDRALGRAGAGALTVALIYADEIVEELPAQPHDVAVMAAVTPNGLLRFAGGE